MGMAKLGKQKVACNETKVIMNKIDQELSKIVGMDSLKLELSKFLKGMLLDQRRRALGLNLGPIKLPHLALHGESGTGKSMVARMLAKLLHMIGILPKDKVTEVQSEDLDKYIPSLWIERAAGGVLLVNYCVIRFDFAYEVEKMKAIIPFMDSEQVVVIIAGNPRAWTLIFKYAELCSRLYNIFDFENYYTSEQLAKILHMKVSVCNNEDEEYSPFRGFKLHHSCTINALAKLIKKVRVSNYWQLSPNGRMVNEMLFLAKENLNSRIDVECADGDSWVTLTMDDFAAAFS